jgi:hypothetical protein
MVRHQMRFILACSVVVALAACANTKITPLSENYVRSFDGLDDDVVCSLRYTSRDYFDPRYVYSMPTETDMVIVDNRSKLFGYLANRGLLNDRDRELSSAENTDGMQYGVGMSACYMRYALGPPGVSNKRSEKNKAGDIRYVVEHVYGARINEKKMFYEFNGVIESYKVGQ